MMKQKGNILIIRLSALGDVAMTVPAVYSLALAYPSVNVKVLTDERFVPLFVGHPANVSFIPYSKRRDGSVKGLWRLLARLHRADISYVADFHNVLRSWVIDAVMLLSGCKVRMLQKQRSRRRALLSGHVSGVRPFVVRYFDVLEALGFSTAVSFDRLSFPHRECPVPFTKQGERWIGIAPFARYETKVYPPALMEQVVAALSRQPHTRVFLFGGGEREVAVLRRWADRYECVFTVAGEMGLERELRLMSCLDVMLTMDSANMHLAALVGTRVVSVWGSTSPACGFLGWNQSPDDALCLNIPCQPCSIAGCKRCREGHFDCLKMISPEQILDRLAEPSPGESLHG